MSARYIGADARKRLIDLMATAQQTSGLSILEHGQAVADQYRDLVEHLRHGTPLRGEWRLPEWISDTRIIEQLPCDDMMAEYHLFHDVGKPLCRIVDEDGRQHFPDHARVSAQTWREAGGDEQIARLIEEDMDIHLLKGDDVQAFAQRPYAIAQLLTGLAEVHANARMFGGIESTSFKIKWKHIDKRGRAILKAIGETTPQQEKLAKAA